ncbi:hypothetical protein BCR44DRAFT_230184, partial [Catenaria anguillulae PL171]
MHIFRPNSSDIDEHTQRNVTATMFRRLYSTSSDAARIVRITPVGLNRVTLIGRLADPPREILLSKGDDASPSRYATSFTVMTTDKRYEKTDKEESTSFINQYHKVISYDTFTHKYFMDRLQAGVSVYVEGKLVTKKWTDASGANRYTTEIDASAQNGRVILVNDKVPEGFGAHKEGGEEAYVPESKR